MASIEAIKKEIDLLEGQTGITFSGGDPFFQAESCSEIARYCQEKGLNVWCYTGFTYEKLLELSIKNESILNFLSQIDVLVDGKFIQEQKSYDAIFRGSKNQRIIDVKSSLRENKVCLVDKYDLNKSKIEKKQKIYI